MNLGADDALHRLAGHHHAVLCTLHPERGVDAVPVAFAVVDGHVGVPVDLVKPKASLRLQRERNLEADPRATLLAEHWDTDDWSQLWWVRAELRAVSLQESASGIADALGAELERRYAQYTGRPFTRVIVLRIEAVTGWAAGPAGGVPAAPTP